MVLVRETYLRMSEEVRKELTGSPGAFKAWFACVMEGIDAEELERSAKIREMYGINKNTVQNRKELIDRAHDEYYLMSAFENFEL